MSQQSAFRVFSIWYSSWLRSSFSQLNYLDLDDLKLQKGSKLSFHNSILLTTHNNMWLSCISELKTKEADILATQIALQQLQERDQLLCAQNEMLKVCQKTYLWFEFPKELKKNLIVTVSGRWTRPISWGRLQNWMTR